MLRAHLTRKSANAKTGPIPVSTTTSRTCPASCPFNKGNTGGCYASGGPLAIAWRKVDAGTLGGTWEDFCAAIASLPAGQLWRHNQAGDLPGEGDAIDTVALERLVEANDGKRGFTYTHKPMIGDSETHIENRYAVARANALGFTVNLSANNPAHADALANERIAPVVTVLPADTPGKTVKTPAGRTVVVCPATYREDVTCASCGLCQRKRETIVGFPAHGAAKRKADAVARG